MKIIAQFFGLLALLLMFMSYQKNKKKEFLHLQVFANIFFGIQYLLLNAISACFSSFISTIKTVVFYKYEKEDKKISVLTLLIFEIIYIVFGIFTYNGLASIIPIFIACIYTYGTWQKNLKLTYSIGVFVAILWIYYNYIVGAYVAIIGSIFEFIASATGLIKLLKDKNNKQEII